jgi:ribonuclease J
MNEQKPGDDQTNSRPEGHKESKLDLWIKQTLKLGNQKPTIKPAHQPTQNAASAPQRPASHPQKHFRSSQSRAPHHAGYRGTTQSQHTGAHASNAAQPGGAHNPLNTSHPFASHPARPGSANNQARRPLFGGLKHKLRIVALGGLNEVGKNCMALEYGNDIIIIDLGFQFPDENMLGVDYVLPDMSYLNDKVNRIRGVFFTHGHLDHIGAVPYLTPKLNFPDMYGTRLTMALVEKRLEEFGLLNKAKIRVIKPNDIIKVGQFTVQPFAVNHSIPDSVGFFVKTPAGSIVHTGDFKFDFTPSGMQKPADFASIAQFANQNVSALFIDSTNAQKPGYTISEKVIGESLEGIFRSIKSRILIASFASQIGRLQTIIDLAQKYKRSIFISGRSLIDNIAITKKLGYLRVPEGLIHDVKKVHKIPEENSLILTTGSQGEDVSALTRMASEEHQAVKITKGDTVILSSSPIPGNERAITAVTNNLSRLGARIINNQIMDVHASGHAQQEDLKLMMNLVKPKYIIPVHGEYFMRYCNTEIAQSLGYDDKHTVMIENGDILEIADGEIKIAADKAQNNYILVDGLGVGDIGAQVITDRQTLAENGVLIVIIPVDEKSRKIKGEIEVVSRGFVYMKESEEILKSIKTSTETAYRNIMEKRPDAKRTEIKKYISEALDRVVHQKIERHPLVLTLILEK